MACAACEARRREMALIKEAFMEWTHNPLGPTFREIADRLRAEQQSKPDDGLRPNS